MCDIFYMYIHMMYYYNMYILIRIVYMCIMYVCLIVCNHFLRECTYILTYILCMYMYVDMQPCGCLHSCMYRSSDKCVLLEGRAMRSGVQLEQQIETFG